MSHARNAASDHLPVIFSCFFAPVLYGVIWLSTGAKAFPWDGNWYREISQLGYQFNGDIRQQSNVAFLPGYPIVIYIFSLIPGLQIVVSQFLASAFSYLIGSIFLFKYVERRVNSFVATVFLFLFSISPFSIYLFNGYSESLFFGLAGMYFYFLSRNSFFLCALVVSYALITRPHAVIMAVILGGVLVLHYYKNDNSAGAGMCNRLIHACADSLKYLPLVILFPAALTVYYFLKFDDTIVYVNAISAWSEFSPRLTLPRQFDFLLSALAKPTEVTDLKDFSLGFIKPLQFSALYLLMQIGATFALIFGFQLRYVPEIVVFSILIIVFGACTGSAVNMGRHHLMAFSFQLFVAVILNDIYTGTFRCKFGVFCSFVVGGVFVILTAIFSAHFFVYGFRQIHGAWIS